MKRIVLIVIAFLTIASSSASAEIKHLTIVHLNDLHGHLLADKSTGGASRIASVVGDIKKENDSRNGITLILIGGDAISGTLISSAFKGFAEIDFFNELGVDAMVVGNHEFDNSFEALHKMIDRAKFPVLAANITQKNSSKRPFKGDVVIDKNGERIGIFGIISKNTRLLTNPTNLDGLHFLDPIAESQRRLKGFDKGVLFKVALTHQGVSDDVKLATRVRGFDVIIGGHDHVSPEEYCRMVGDIPVCQTPAEGSFVGRLDFEIDGNKRSYLGSKLIPITDDLPKDAAMEAAMAGYASTLQKTHGSVLGIASHELTDQGQGKMSPVGAFIAEVFLKKMGADLSLMNSSGIRSGFPKGPIKEGDIFNVMPFPNMLELVDAPGHIIKAALDHAIGRGRGSFPQTAGITFDIVDHRASNIKIADQPIDPDKIYRLATIDYLLNGGSGFVMLQGLRVEKMGGSARDAVVEYIKMKKTIP